jgi:hypothetical protein
VTGLALRRLIAMAALLRNVFTGFEIPEYKYLVTAVLFLSHATGETPDITSARSLEDTHVLLDALVEEIRSLDIQALSALEMSPRQRPLATDPADAHEAWQRAFDAVYRRYKEVTK